MDKKIRIITVDDHEIFRKGLNLILNQTPSFEVIGEARNGKEFLELLKYLSPDIVFMDIRMPIMDGIETTKNALKKHPTLKIIAISMFGEEEYLERMIKAGANGFLLKNVNKEEIELAIRRVSQGKKYYSSDLLPYFTHKYISKKPFGTAHLTKRELDVLKLVAKGLTNKEIALALFISKRTVDGHKAKILEKTDSKNVVSLLVYAIKKGLIKI